MIMGKEKEVEKEIMDYIRGIGGYCQKVHSGSIYKSYRGKMQKIKLADEGTPDIIACIDGKFFGIEVKKDEKAFNHWVNVIDKYCKTGEYSKSNKRIINQFEEKTKIIGAGGRHILTYSLEDFKSKILI